MNVTATTQPTGPAMTASGDPRGPQPQATGGKDLPARGTRPPADRPRPAVHIDIDKAIEQIKAYLNDSRRQLDFQFDERSGHTVIKVINPASGEVIRQIPSEEVVKVAAMLNAEGFHTINDTA